MSERKIYGFEIQCHAHRCPRNARGFKFRGARKCLGCPFAWYKGKKFTKSNLEAEQ